MKTDSKSENPKIGLALAGGGVEGAIYEIGALCALQEFIEGVDFNDLDIYVGVSAGALVASGLANGLTPWEMNRISHSHGNSLPPVTPESFFKPATGEYFYRLTQMPGSVVSMLWQYATNPWDTSILGALSGIVHHIPSGLFDNTPLREYLERLFEEYELSDDFKHTSKPLRIVTTDLDAGATTVFGGPGYDHIPISLAVQASTALPGLFMPVEIEGRYYIDGIARKTVHASVALEAGMDLVFSVNPLVPLESPKIARSHEELKKNLRKSGFSYIMAQTLRTIIHSRMTVGFDRYTRQFPNSDLLLFEPPADDESMFYTNVFSFSKRFKVADKAFQHIREQLLEKKDYYADVLQRHGLQLNFEKLHQITTIENHPRLGVMDSGDVSVNLEATLNRLESMLSDEDGLSKTG